TTTYNQFVSDFPSVASLPVDGSNANLLNSLLGAITVNTLTSVSSLNIGTTLSNGILTYIENMVFNTLGLVLPATYVDATRLVPQTTILPTIRDTMNKTTYVEIEVSIPKSSFRSINSSDMWSNAQINPSSKIKTNTDETLAANTFIVTSLKYVTTTFL
ncbi:MAG: hypothetical protein ACPGU0_00990, partial [Marinirhabdus sp.]